MSPALIAIVLGTGMLAFVPTARLARRDVDRWAVTGYFLVVWALLAALLLAPGLARLGVPVLVVLVVAPWVDARAALDRLLGRPPRPRRPPPRNVTPPEAGGPWRP